MVAIPKLITTTVTTAGTRVRIFSAPYTKIAYLYVRNKSATTNLLYVGDVTVANASTNGVKLGPQDATYPMPNSWSLQAPEGMLISTESFYLDASVNGTVAEIFYLEVL